MLPLPTFGAAPSQQKDFLILKAPRKLSSPSYSEYSENQRWDLPLTGLCPMSRHFGCHTFLNGFANYLEVVAINQEPQTENQRLSSASFCLEFWCALQGTKMSAPHKYSHLVSWHRCSYVKLSMLRWLQIIILHDILLIFRGQEQCSFLIVNIALRKPSIFG